MKKLITAGFFVFLTCAIVGCSKEEEAYDPTGKCGSVLSSTVSTSVPTVWDITVSMDDGKIYKTASVTPYTLGARVCF